MKKCRNQLRIMHGISEVAGQNGYSVQGLRLNGEKATSVVAYKHPFDYPFDICLGIDKSNKKKYPIYALKAIVFTIYALCNYDVFHFHFGRSICLNKELRLYDLLKKDYYYEFHGSDLRMMEKFCETSKQSFSDEMATSRKMIKRNNYIAKKATGIILHDDELIPYLPEHHAPVYVVPLRVNLDRYALCLPKKDVTTITIVHGSKNREGKGTDYVVSAVQNLKKRYPNIDLILVEGLTQDEARKIYEKADIIVDQLFTGTYGVFAIESMALGKPVITYISNEMKAKLPKELPIVSADKDEIENKLEMLISSEELRRHLGKEGREYVERYHDYRKNAIMLDDIYHKKLAPIHGRESFEYVKRIK